jgi:hypothetical protein
MSLLHHVLMYPVFRLVYRTSVPGSRHAAWYPLGNFLIDFILLRAVRMCLTGEVTWRGTSYRAAPAIPQPVAEKTTPTEDSVEAAS